MARAYIGMGANLGDRVGTLRQAVQRLRKLGRITAVSSLYETEPVGYLEQSSFLNAVVGLKTTVTPAEFLQALLAIERDLGRTRTFPNAPRTLDLDLLLVDAVVLDTAELILPHPRLHERAFVLVPLAEIAPKARHPILKQSVADLLLVLPDRKGIDTFASPGWEPAPTR